MPITRIFRTAAINDITERRMEHLLEPNPFVEGVEPGVLRLKWDHECIGSNQAGHAVDRLFDSFAAIS